MMLYLQKFGGAGFVINPGLSGNWWGGEARNGEGFLTDVSKSGDGDTIIDGFLHVPMAVVWGILRTSILS
jgi:hypothetical protein